MGKIVGRCSNIFYISIFIQPFACLYTKFVNVSGILQIDVV